MGMGNTFLRREDAEEDGKHIIAAEYWWDEGEESYLEVPHVPDGRGREPAGMAISNVEDYAKYLRVMINEEAPISEAGHRAIKTPRMLLPSSSLYDVPMSYCLGWVRSMIDGENYWSHNGRIREHVTEMWIVPEKNLGVVVMINANQPSVVSAVAKRVVSEHLGTNQGISAMEPVKASKSLASEDCKNLLYPQLLAHHSRTQFPWIAMLELIKMLAMGPSKLGGVYPCKF